MSKAQWSRKVSGAQGAVVFLHGILESPRQFEDFINVVPKEYAVYNLCLPGHDSAVNSFARSSAAQWRAFVRGQIEEIGQKHEKILLVGHSMGALLAIEVAAAFSEKIAGVFLLAVPFCIRVKPSGIFHGWKVLQGRCGEDPLSCAVQRTFCLAQRVPLRILPQWIPRYRELFRMAKEVRTFPAKILCPVVVWQSGKDEFVGKGSVKYVKNAPHVTTLTAARSYHFYYLSKERQEILQSFLEFLEKSIPI